jgi:hypothetical protein
MQEFKKKKLQNARVLNSKGIKNNWFTGTAKISFIGTASPKC